MRNRIIIKESELRRLIRESVRHTLNELSYEKYNKAAHDANDSYLNTGDYKYKEQAKRFTRAAANVRHKQPIGAETPGEQASYDFVGDYHIDGWDVEIGPSLIVFTPTKEGLSQLPNGESFVFRWDDEVEQCYDDFIDIIDHVDGVRTIEDALSFYISHYLN